MSAQHVFPSDLDFINPYIFFWGYDASYNINGNLEKTALTDTIALYMPTNYTVNDQLTYDLHQGGSAEAAKQMLKDSWDDRAETLYNEGIRQAGRATATGVGRALPGSDPAAVRAIATGVVSNPYAFTIFKAPVLRNFSFNFDFIPKNQNDVDSMFDIIRTFRLAAYPEFVSDFAYSIPKMFNISIIDETGGNHSGMIRTPDCACESVQVTFNPSSMSFFKYNGAPSKVNLSLGFKEIRQLTREDIEEGF